MIDYEKMRRDALAKLPKQFRREYEGVVFKCDPFAVKWMLAQRGIADGNLQSYLVDCTPRAEEFYFGAFCALGLEALIYYNFRLDANLGAGAFVIGRDESCCPVIWESPTGAIKWQDGSAVMKQWGSVLELYNNVDRFDA